eukprot:14097326-Alexandrium_andersonii.AAC.1
MQSHRSGPVPEKALVCCWACRGGASGRQQHRWHGHQRTHISHVPHPTPDMPDQGGVLRKG